MVVVVVVVGRCPRSEAPGAPTTYCLLPTTYCLLVTTYHLLRATYHLPTYHQADVFETSAKANPIPIPNPIPNPNQADVFETSAKAGQGVGDIFQCIVTHYQNRAQAGGGGDGGRGLQTGGAQQKQGCC